MGNPSKAIVREVAEVIAEVLEKQKRAIYREKFFRTMTIGDFNDAWRAAIAYLAMEDDK